MLISYKKSFNITHRERVLKIKSIEKNLVFTVYPSSYIPKINTGKKTCWSDTSVLIDGKKIDVFWESMRGKSFYFFLNGICYNIPFFLSSNPLKENYNDDILYGENWIILTK